MSCSILDFRCIFVNELIGSVALSIIFLVILYFIIAAKARFGFETTIALIIPILLILSLALGGFSLMLIIGSIVAAVLAAYAFNKLIGNR